MNFTYRESDACWAEQEKSSERTFDVEAWSLGAQDAADLLHWEGVSRLLGGDPAAAKALLVRAASAAPHRTNYHCNLAEALLRTGDNASALAAAEQALLLHPRYVAAHVNRAAALFALGRFREALADYEFAIAHRRDDRQHDDRGRDDRGQDDRGQDDADLIAYRGDCLRELGEWRAARYAYTRALRRDPNLAHAHANLGPLLLLFGKPAAALRHCERAVALDAGHAEAWMNLAHCRIELEQLDEAMDAYAEAFARDPQSRELCCRISVAWQQAGDYEQAALWLGRAWIANPAARG